MSKPEIGIHPYAEFFPLIEGKAFERFCEGMKIRGLERPILYIREGKKWLIVDGRNRYRACLELGIEPVFEEWNGKGSLLELSMSLNLDQRHMDDFQRACAVVPYKKELAIKAAQRQKTGKPSAKNGGSSNGQAGERACAEEAQMIVPVIELNSWDLIGSLRSAICPGCAFSKRCGQTLCRSCYGSLLPSYQTRLYDRVGAGYEEAFANAMLCLDVTDITLPDDFQRRNHK